MSTKVISCALISCLFLNSCSSSDEAVTRTQGVFGGAVSGAAAAVKAAGPSDAGLIYLVFGFFKGAFKGNEYACDLLVAKKSYITREDYLQGSIDDLSRNTDAIRALNEQLRLQINNKNADAQQLHTKEINKINTEAHQLASLSVRDISTAQTVMTEVNADEKRTLNKKIKELESELSKLDKNLKILINHAKTQRGNT